MEATKRTEVYGVSNGRCSSLSKEAKAFCCSYAHTISGSGDTTLQKLITTTNNFRVSPATFLCQLNTNIIIAIMKKLLLSVAMLLAAGSAFAQVNVQEPEFINSYCILTSDSTYATLPKESGTLAEHKSKVKKWTKWLKGAADLAGAGGMIGAATAGSLSGLSTGLRVMGGAAGVSSAAGTVSSLAGSSGMDIVFKGGHSSYSFKADGQDARLLIKGETNEVDPMDCYRIVRFNASKKERKIQWMEFESALIGSEDTKKAGYVPFTGHKYGEQSYLIIIPASELEKGEYGIFYMSIISATAIPVGTFGIN